MDLLLAPMRPIRECAAPRPILASGQSWTAMNARVEWPRHARPPPNEGRYRQGNALRAAGGADCGHAARVPRASGSRFGIPFGLVYGCGRSRCCTGQSHVTGNASGYSRALRRLLNLRHRIRAARHSRDSGEPDRRGSARRRCRVGALEIAGRRHRRPTSRPASSRLIPQAAFAPHSCVAFRCAGPASSAPVTRSAYIRFQLG